jgi:hypothetical protein
LGKDKGRLWGKREIEVEAAAGKARIMLDAWRTWGMMEGANEG